MFLYNPIGKTLEEVCKDCGPNLNGYAIFVLDHEADTIGRCIGEDVSITSILKQYTNGADYLSYIVKLENDFYGETILRIIHPEMYELKEDCER